MIALANVENNPKRKVYAGMFGGREKVLCGNL